MAAEQPHDAGGTELGRFLRARRSQVTPADVGFAPGTGVRRTPGLRREEVAALAGASIDYYTRLERGKETRPSPSVTDALARALKLDPDEGTQVLVCARSSSCCWRPSAPTRLISRAGPWTCWPSTRAPSRSTPALATGPPRSATSAVSCSCTPPGQRLGVYLAQAGTPDYDAMILLDMTAPAVAESRPRTSGAVASKERTGHGISDSGN